MRGESDSVVVNFSKGNSIFDRSKARARTGMSMGMSTFRGDTSCVIALSLEILKFCIEIYSQYRELGKSNSEIYLLGHDCTPSPLYELVGMGYLGFRFNPGLIGFEIYISLLS